MYSADPPWWLPDGHSQTIVPALWASWRWPNPVRWSRQRWDSPDGDFIDVDVVGADPSEGCQPLVVVFHGLEGSSGSHYAKALALACLERGWACAVPHFRGCSGHINRLPRAYHSGDHAEIDWILTRFHQLYPLAPLLAVGISLGGNALARWAGELGSHVAQVARALACVCAPLDLVASGLAMGAGLNRVLYTRMFLKTMVPKALCKLEQHPGLFSAADLVAAKDLKAFDDVFTAPLHGFADAMDYWQRASAKPLLRSVAVPTVLVNPLNDPFVPAQSLPIPSDVADCVTLWQPAHGGHVGFPTRTPRGMAPHNGLMALPRSVLDWLAPHAA
jgi:hypothetical protein